MAIGITIGDPAGIGPEVTLKALNALQLPTHAVKLFGSRTIWTRVAEQLHLPIPYEIVDIPTPSDIKVGEPSAAAGKLSYDAFVTAVDAALRGTIRGLVTAPINKYSWHLSNIPYAGHTDLLAELTHAPHYAMLMLSPNLRVTLVTTHIPIHAVADALTATAIIEKVELTHTFLTHYLNISTPHIAVLGLNPHAGDHGVIGDEELRIILPAIQELQRSGYHVSGPHPADSYFAHHTADAVIAMYHDQGLIPVKLTSFGRAINVTLGLPFIRTSPDHGTAYEIAGRGIADHSSMLEAIKSCYEWSQKVSPWTSTI